MKKQLIAVGCCLAVVATAVAWLQAAAPVIDSVAATPAVVPAGVTTAVRFTATITDPSVQPGINLLRVDSAGKNLANLGAMLDDGLNGDSVAGDKTFTKLVNLSEPNTGIGYFQVSAPFKGALRRILSPLIDVAIWSPFEHQAIGLSGATPPSFASLERSIGSDREVFFHRPDFPDQPPTFSVRVFAFDPPGADPHSALITLLFDSQALVGSRPFLKGVLVESDSASRLQYLQYNRDSGRAIHIYGQGTAFLLTPDFRRFIDGLQF